MIANANPPTRLLSKTHLQNRTVSPPSSPCLTCAIYVVWNCLETGPIFRAYFCLRMKGDAPPMWHILVKVGWEMLGGMRDLRHLCGHSQPDFGEWVGLAPSMSPKGSLMLRKTYGCKPGQKVAKNRSFLGTYMAQTTWWSIYPPALCSHLLWGGVHGQGLC